MRITNMERRVALYISQSLGYGRGLIRGAMAYARPQTHHKEWLFGLYDAQSAYVEDELKSFRPDGVIAHLYLEQAVAIAGRLRCPVVNTSNSLAASFPRVGVDDHSIGRAAARHFLERGFRNFAFFGSTGVFFGVRRGSYIEELRAAGFKTADVLTWQQEQGPKVLREQLLASPKPLAVFAGSDPTCWRLAELCRGIGIHVPEQVALLGVDNDAFLCGLASPQLSSIRLPLEKMGFAAAELLDGLMRGTPPPAAPLLFPPVDVVTRQSTDVFAVEDADVAAALRFIKQNLHRPMKVEEILGQLNISRRALECKFRKALGRSPLKEIHRVQVERATGLLLSTDLPVSAVASQCGFSGAVQFWSVFKQHLGIAPLEFRTRHRLTAVSGL